MLRELHMSSKVPAAAGTSWETANPGDWAGVQGLEPPWNLWPPILLWESVSLNVRFWVEPNWRLSGVSSKRTLCHQNQSKQSWSIEVGPEAQVTT